MLDLIARGGRRGLDAVARFGRAGITLGRTLTAPPDWRQGPAQLVLQLQRIGVHSLVIVVVSALFIGMVLSLQGYTTLTRFGAAEALGQLVSLTLVRELGPVVTALLFAGRAGSALTAEVALMKTTEQLAAMEMMGIDPLRRVVRPRFIAGLIAMPVLALVFNCVAIFGAVLVGVDWLGVDAGSFWGNMQAAVDFRGDVLNGIVKSVVFGFVVTWIALFEGLDAEPTAAGISAATTRTVVYSSLAILGLDFLLTATMFGLL